MSLRFCFQIYANFINTFINFMKKFLMKKKIKREVEALEKIKALVLPILDFFIRS